MRISHLPRLLLAFCLVVSFVGTFSASAAEKNTASKPKTATAKHLLPDATEYRSTVTKAVAYLKGAQAPDGSFSAQAGPGVTALITTSLMRSGKTPSDPMIANALKYLQTFVQKDGGVYANGSTHQNYETCLAILCFSEANKAGKYNKLIKAAEKHIRDGQWDEGEDITSSDDAYGGAGYGKHKRPDLSNTNFLIEALKATGAGEDDPAMKKALLFVSKCQNLETTHNETKYATKNPDGGFYYTIAAGGSSQAGDTVEGGLRSYGSMTYAGLKSMIYAGVGPDDPRVKAAFVWVSKHYSLEKNPGMGNAGLYYYYQTFAKALDAIGKDEIIDTDGTKHAWKKELAEALQNAQKKNGSFVNTNGRWLEGDPNLVTAYALLALSYCKW